MQTELLALPTPEQTMQTAASIYTRQFRDIALCLMDDGVEGLVREMLSVLPHASLSHTAHAALSNVVTLLRIHKAECERNYDIFRDVCNQRNVAQDKMRRVANLARAFTEDDPCFLP